MKTQVIHLDVHDDIISIRDRMAWAKTPRILLVWPRRGRVDVRPLDLTLLRRHAESLGAELGIVTRNGEMRSAAREHGISYFSTTANAQKKQWVEKHPARIMRRFPRQDFRAIRTGLPSAELFSFMVDPIRRIAVFSAGMLAVLAVILALLPSAEIQITSPDQKQSLTIAVSAAPGEKTVQLSGIVPQRILSLDIDGKATALATGKIIRPDQPATGEAVLMNLTDKRISIPAGAILQTHTSPPVSFLTQEMVEITAGKGKTVRVAIRAQAAGLRGNVSPGSITTIEGSLGLSLAVTNPASTTGGNETSFVLATEQDRSNLKKRLLTDLERQAFLLFPAKISTGDVLLPGTLVQTRTLEESFSPRTGEPDEKLSLAMRIEFSIRYASFVDLNLLAGRVLDVSLPPGFSAVPGQINLKMTSALSEDTGTIRWRMLAERSMRANLNGEQVISIIQGKSAGRAVNLLTNAYGLVKTPQIKIQPGWWPWLPFLPMRITVSG